MGDVRDKESLLRERGSKQNLIWFRYALDQVAPLRERGSKPLDDVADHEGRGRSLTGARIGAPIISASDASGQQAGLIELKQKLA